MKQIASFLGKKKCIFHYSLLVEGKLCAWDSNDMNDNIYIKPQTQHDHPPSCLLLQQLKKQPKSRKISKNYYIKEHEQVFIFLYGD